MSFGSDYLNLMYLVWYTGTVCEQYSHCYFCCEQKPSRKQPRRVEFSDCFERIQSTMVEKAEWLVAPRWQGKLFTFFRLC